MTRWEYKSEEAGHSESVNDVLKRMGHAGWEAWHMTRLDIPGTHHTIYFKRQAKE